MYALLCAYPLIVSVLSISFFALILWAIDELLGSVEPTDFIMCYAIAVLLSLLVIGGLYALSQGESVVPPIPSYITHHF